MVTIKHKGVVIYRTKNNYKQAWKLLRYIRKESQAWTI